MAVVNLLPLGHPNALVVGSVADPVQEVQVHQVMQDVRDGPRNRHRDDWQGDEYDVKDCEEEQIGDPDSSAVPPRHLGI